MEANSKCSKVKAKPVLMVGCHRTARSSDSVGFSSGSFDEVAIWKYRVDNGQVFLGGGL